MQQIQASSQIFQSDQQYQFSVTTFDTPFTVLHGGVASAGIPFDLREPLSTGVFTLLADIKNEAVAANVPGIFTDNARSKSVVSSGRVPIVQEYWAGGGLGKYGNSVNKRVALRYTCTLRSATGRGWFDGASTPTFTLAVAGNGYLRIQKLKSGVYTDLFNADITEADFRLNGLRLTSTISDMVAGDQILIYYVQDQHVWGGLVVKAIQGTLPVAVSAQQAAGRDAPILGCGLMDDGTPPTARTIAFVKDLAIDQAIGTSTSVTFGLPLINMSRNDDIGWEWSRSGQGDPGVLRSHTGTGATFDLKRQRLVQIQAGYKNELYTVFTGFVDDYQLDTTGRALVKCLSFEARATDQFVKNWPDKISYMAAAYKNSSGTSEPVYEVPAYDNWPVEYALRDLISRAGVDSSSVLQPLTVPGVSTAQTVVFGTETFKKFRARSLAGVPIRLERPVHYGNFGSAFTEAKPADDPYIFTPENTQDIWASCRKLSDRYGYDLRFDHLGHLALQARNNPHYVDDLLAGFGGGTLAIMPSAYAGTTVEFTGSVAPVVKTYSAARIDVSVPLGSYGAWSYTVVRVSDSVTVASGTITPTGTQSIGFYDYRFSVDGTNATVVTLYSGTYDSYQVTLQSSGGSTSTVRRLDCFLLYHTDPSRSLYPSAFSTVQNAFQVHTESTMNEMRNFVIVVGRRRAVVTDSSKLDTNPDNPADEFVVRSAVDVGSITSPAAKNYIGYPKEAVIYDTGITDEDFATYLAQTFIYRQRSPNPSAPIDHTMVPVIQLRDPLFASEEGFKSIDSSIVLFVTGIQHRISETSALTTIQTSSYPEYPAYEPRSDIDIDANYSGSPATNVALTYKSLTGNILTNVAADSAVASTAQDIVTVSALPNVGGVLTIPGDWPPIPGTVQIRVSSGGAPAGTAKTTNISLMNLRPNSAFPAQSLPRFQSLTSIVIRDTFNNTYTNIPSRPIAGNYFYYEWDQDTEMLTIVRTTEPRPGVAIDQFTVAINWVQAADGVIPEYITNSPYHRYFDIDYTDSGRKLSLVWKEGDETSVYKWGLNGSSFDVRYRRLGLDPYSGVSPFYDPYSSEIGELVTIGFDALISGVYRISVRNYEDNTIVAWLTEPTTSPTDVEAHWQFMEAGAGKSFAWDGVDQVGAWNQRQSQSYAAAAQGVFEQEQRPVIGSGFYVWNEEFRSGRLAPLAVIAADRTAAGVPVFGVGTHARWYVLIEARSDALETTTGNGYRAMDTQTPVRVSGGYNPMRSSAVDGVIHTHLPEPTKVNCRINDWQTGTPYDPALDNWGNPDTEATLNNQKPVRIRFTGETRPGTLWATQSSRAMVRLFRMAHLRASIYDQFMIYDGVNYSNSTFESRRVVTRRLVNDNHTLLFADDAFRRVMTFKQISGAEGTEWIFFPKDCRKNYRGVDNEILAFADYLQLEEVPKWSDTNRIGNPRSRLNIAFMSYLFYLSAYTQDLSGRFMWCVNTQFVDKAKIIKQTAAAGWPIDVHRQHRRSIFVRQWADEDTWKATEMARWGFDTNSIGAYLLRHTWGDHDLSSSTIAGVSWPALSLDAYSKNTNRLPSGFAALTRQLGAVGSTYLSRWSWEGGFNTSMWVPCITRDFYPYRLVPPMLDKLTANGNVAYEQSDLTANQEGDPYNIGDDVAATGSEVWNSAVRDESSTTGDTGSDHGKKFFPGTRVTYQTTPTNTIYANTLDYQRQDESIHYEDCRGVFSRTARPAAAPAKVVSSTPYYLNQFRYANITVQDAYHNPTYPLFRADMTHWFSHTFRYEYLWESGTMFPTDPVGKEWLFMMNKELGRYAPQLDSIVRYDDGAWAGWKDDQVNSGEGDATNYKLFSGATVNVFHTKYMPLAVGPRLAVTRDMLFHLVLVDQRREFPTGF